MTKNRKLVYFGLAIWFGAIFPVFATEGIREIFPRWTICPSPFPREEVSDRSQMNPWLRKVHDWAHVESNRVLPYTVGFGFALGLFPILLGKLVKPIPAARPISWSLLFSVAFSVLMIPVFVAFFDVFVVNGY